MDVDLVEVVNSVPAYIKTYLANIDEYLYQIHL